MELFSSLHIAALSGTAILTCIALFPAIRRGTDARSRSWGAALGGSVLTLWVVYVAYYFAPANFRWEVSLPLHVCDVMGLVAGLALVWPRRWFRALLYFFGLGLTTQALVTPTGEHSLSHPRFWLYWGLHAGILACALHDLIIRGYRPTWRDLGLALIFGLAYVLVILPINLFFDWNYGYVGDSKPGEPTLLDVLGPWPLRVVNLILLTSVLQLVLLLPWVLLRSRGASSR